MKAITALLILFVTLTNVRAQNYMISFAGTGASNSVDSVKVENLSQCTSLTLAGTDILNLTSTVGLNEHDKNTEGLTEVYPNPSTGNFSIVLESASVNELRIVLYDVSGKVVLQCEDLIKQGRHVYQLSGIRSGLYLLMLESSKFKYSTKLISSTATNANPEIKNTSHESSIKKVTEIPGNSRIANASGNKSVIGMLFNSGDTLKLTGKSGIFRTVCMLFPIQSQTVTFNFTKCTDADSNHYAVVQLGTQLWMQENLKATHYRDGSAIPNVTDSATWANITTGAYCNYHNDSAEGAYYGRLYNYFAVEDARNLCPIGWHASTNHEWNVMEKFVDNTVDTTALGGTGLFIGRIMKEGCNTRWQYYDSTAGWNSAGFTALCTNFRTAIGSWSLAPNNNHDDSFWTATSFNANQAWNKSFRWCACDIFTIYIFKRAGGSVRCIKD